MCVIHFMHLLYQLVEYSVFEYNFNNILYLWPVYWPLNKNDLIAAMLPDIILLGFLFNFASWKLPCNYIVLYIYMYALYNNYHHIVKKLALFFTLFRYDYVYL